MDQLILPLLLLLLFVPLIMSFRRQRRQFAQMQQLQSSLNVGDKVLTTSGLKATIVAATEDTVDLEIAPGVVTTWVRQAVRERLDDVPAPADEADLVAGDRADAVSADERDRT